jgi:Protein of unknown function (DUF2934)
MGAAMTDRNDRIRELAYLLWLEEGCPEGQSERHWQTAEILFESEGEHNRIEGDPQGETGDDLSAASGAQVRGATSQISRRRSIPAKGT